MENVSPFLRCSCESVPSVASGPVPSAISVTRKNKRAALGSVARVSSLEFVFHHTMHFPQGGGRR